MAAITGAQRNAGQVAAGLGAWFSAEWPAARQLAIGELTWFAKNGLSSETMAFTLGWQDEGGDHQARYVLRLPPAGGPGVFPTYDFIRQAGAQRALAQAGVPAPVPVGAESDPRWLGAPFMVMPYVEGRIPDMRFPSAGWITELDPAERHTLMTNFVGALAHLHVLDWRGTELENFSLESGPGLRSEWDWWERYLAWASVDGEPAEVEAVASLAEWCKSNWPDTEPAGSVLWGDPRIGNTVFDDDFGVRAMLDWEGISVGPAEIDLGWHYAYRRTNGAIHRVRKFPELEGFLTDEQEIAQWESIVGRPVENLEWYVMFGALRLSAILLSIRRASRASGNDRYARAALMQDWVLTRLRT